MMENEMRVSLLCEDHLSVASEIFVETFKGAPWNENWDVDKAYQRLHDILLTPRSCGVLVEKLSPSNSFVPASFAIGVFEVWHSCLQFQIKELCVHPQFQRLGLGDLTVQSIINNAKKLGAHEVYLMTAHNSPAEKLYAKHGFKTVPHMQIMDLKY